MGEILERRAWKLRKMTQPMSDEQKVLVEAFLRGEAYIVADMGLCETVYLTSDEAWYQAQGCVAQYIELPSGAFVGREKFNKMSLAVWQSIADGGSVLLAEGAL